jgi:hypothetical protein
MDKVYNLVNMAKTKFSKSKLILSGVLGRRNVPLRHIGALNDRSDWVVKTLGANSLDPNTWTYMIFEKNNESTNGLFADDFIIYRKIEVIMTWKIYKTDLNRLGEWALENEMKINPFKTKAVCYTKAPVPESLNYSLGVIEIPKANSCKCLEIILGSDLSWTNQVNYTVKKAWKALHFKMRALKGAKQ